MDEMADTGHREAVTGVSGQDSELSLPCGTPLVVTYTIGADEWVLLAPPAGTDPGMLRRAVLAWLDCAPPPSPGRSVKFFRVSAADPVPGPAMLHYRPGFTAICCGQDDLGKTAAKTLSNTAAIWTPVLLGNASQNGQPRVTVATVSHDRWLHPALDDWLRPSLHPVLTHVAPPQTTINACDCQVTPALAEVLTALCTEYLRLLHARSTAARPRSI
jgi:hypothetical protein